MAEAVIDARTITASLRLRVKGLRALRIRCALAAKLFAFAAWVAGCPCTVEADPTP